MEGKALNHIITSHSVRADGSQRATESFYTTVTPANPSSHGLLSDTHTHTHTHSHTQTQTQTLTLTHTNTNRLI